MSKWKATKPKKLSNGLYRPVVSRFENGKKIRKRLSDLAFKSEKEAILEAEFWIRDEAARAVDNYIADGTKTIGGFIEEYYHAWRDDVMNFKGADPTKFYRFLKENDWWDTLLVDINKKWCSNFRAAIASFKRLDGKPYKAAYKDICSELNHLLDRACIMELVLENYSRGTRNPNSHLVKRDSELAAIRGLKKKEKSWSKKQLQEYLPLFREIPKTKVFSAKKASHLGNKKANIMKADNSDSWKVYWTNEDGDYRSKQFNWKKEGGSEKALLKAEAYAEAVSKTLVSDDICVVEKSQFAGISTEMWFAFMNLSFLLGLRVGEIAALKFSDFSEGYKTVTIQRMLVIRKKQIVEDYPKATSIRTLTVPDALREVIQVLEDYHTLNGTLKLDYLLQYKTGGAIRPDYWQRQYKRVQELVGIPKSEQLPSTHSGRHTHLTLIAEAGVPMPVVQKRAGHSKIATTAEYYIHLADDKQASEALNAILSAEADLEVNNGI
jgi:site-specific recombinase XerD